MPLSILCGPAPARDIHKWIDAGGRVHYSDRPAGRPTQRIEIRQPAAPPPATPGDRRKHRDRLLRAYEEEREIKKRDSAERRAQKQLREKNCSAARRHLAAYQNAQYLYDEDENGNRRVLSFSERDSATKSMRESVEHWCGKS